MSHRKGSDGRTVRHTAQGSPAQDANETREPKPAASEADARHPRPFTFIEHNDSLVSKRIRDPKARRAIRSHVMRDVRFREKQQGKKRGQKREAVHQQREPGAEPSLSNSSDSTISEGSSPKTEDLSPKATKSNSPLDTDSISDEPWEGTLSQRSISSSSRIGWQSPCPVTRGWLPSIAHHPRKDFSLGYRVPSGDFVDPFYALPGEASHSNLVQGLLRHCVDIFLPSLFFVQTKVSASKQNSVISSVIQSLQAEPASLYAILTVCAAHRSLLQRRKQELLFSAEPYIPDRAFVEMEGRAIREFNVKLCGPDKLENSSFEAILALIGATTLVGDFKRMRTHLAGLESMIAARGGVRSNFFLASEFTRNTSILNDLKAALVLKERPVFPIYARSPRLRSASVERLRPPVDSVLASLGTKFRDVPQLVSPKLMEIIEDLRIIIFLSDLGFRRGRLEPDDEQLFSRKYFELEHDLLEYPHAASDTSYTVHPVEEVVRTALLCLSNTSLIQVAPAAALRRAAVSHLMRALNAIQDIFCNLPDIAWDLVMWALYIGIDGACGQPEEESLIKWLGCLAGRRPKMEFGEIVNRCCGFFYVPYSMEKGWKRTWEIVKRQIEFPYIS